MCLIDSRESIVAAAFKVWWQYVAQHVVYKARQTLKKAVTF